MSSKIFTIEIFAMALLFKTPERSASQASFFDNIFWKNYNGFEKSADWVGALQQL